MRETGLFFFHSTHWLSKKKSIIYGLLYSWLYVHMMSLIAFYLLVCLILQYHIQFYNCIAKHLFICEYEKNTKSQMCKTTNSHIQKHGQIQLNVILMQNKWLLIHVL